MKILHVVATCDPVHGAGVAERTRLLTKALTDEGADSTILTENIDLDEKRRAQFAHARLHVLPCLNERFYVPAAWPGTISTEVARADIVELTSHWTVLNVLAYRAARRLGIPYLVHPAGALGIVGRSAAIKRVFNMLVGTRMVRKADGHIAVTRGEAPEYAQYGISADRLTFVPNGVDMPRGAGDAERFRASHGLEDRRIILFVGRLSHIKGPDLLLEAFVRIASDHPNSALVFVGPDHGLLAGLQRTTREHGLEDRVRFAGFLDGSDKDDAYDACDFLALPSRREAMSLVALEAGVRGKPVLITDQCGFSEVEQFGGGLVVEASISGLAAGLSTMISNDARLPAMGAALKLQIGKRYTWPVAAQTYLALCKTVVKRTGNENRAA